MVEAQTLESFEFKWGQMKGRGGRKKDVQFYESFTYDGVEYFLYDSVYLYIDSELEPCIGKLIKIWEGGDKRKKVKVLWFFRPHDILSFLGVEEASENELFLASGEGRGLCNINPLEAISGKCNVVCISKDSRNLQPTDEELKVADYVFCRTFDTGTFKVMDKIDDRIAGIDVKLLFNKMDNKKDAGTQTVDPERKGLCGNAVRNDATVNMTVETSVYGVIDSLNVADNSFPTVKTATFVEIKENVLQHDALVESEGKVKTAYLELDDAPSKKAKLNIKPSAVFADGGKNKLKYCKNSFGTEKGLSEKMKRDDEIVVLSNGELLKAPASQFDRPDADRRKWFKGIPWDDQMQTAFEQGTLVLLQNLDPTYNKEDVKDIVWHGFKESCTAKIIQQRMFCSPYSGQAFVIFKKKGIAEMVVRRLDEGCLLLSNGRPLIGRLESSCFIQRKPQFYGHLVIDKLRYQMPREKRDAVSTSHCSQPNTYEYDMAMEWILLQDRSNFVWKKLYREQEQELEKLKTKLKAGIL